MGSLARRCQTARCAIVGARVPRREHLSTEPADPRAADSKDTADVVTAWLAERGRIVTAIEPMTGDVSTRRYFRVRLAGEPAPHIVALYPPELVAAQLRFSPAARLLGEAGVRVPAIELDEPERRLALLEDLGPETLYERHAGWEECAAELDAALAAAAAIARLPVGPVVALGAPPLDAALLRRELASTIEVFLAPRGLASAELVTALDELCRRLADGPLVPCHRDFMARNLVPMGGGSVAVLDFQDLRLGPPGYDLASLLNDSFYAPASLEQRALGGETGRGLDPLAYRRAVVQRCLKAVGTFVSFAARGKRRHLPLVPATLERALRAAAEVPETAHVVAVLGPALTEGGRSVATC